MPRPAGSTVPLLAMPEAGISRAVYPEIVAGQDGVGRGLTLDLYGNAGDAVVRVCERMMRQQPRPTDDAIRASMAEEIRAQGPENVSHHIPGGNRDVVDVAPSSIPENARETFRQELERAVRDGRLERYIAPGNDPAHHIEIRR